MYTITVGQGINNGGQIVADGYLDATGEDVAFLLNSTTPVPLPPAAWLMISGMGSIGLFARRRTGHPSAKARLP